MGNTHLITDGLILKIDEIQSVWFDTTDDNNKPCHKVRMVSGYDWTLRDDLQKRKV